MPDELLAKFCLAGSPAEVTAQVRSLEKAGIQQVAIHPWSFADISSEDAIRLFANEVIPHFR